MDAQDLLWRADRGFWSATSDDVEVRFVGRLGGPDREETLAAVADAPTPRLAWARQVHGADVLAARPGLCGSGDALESAEPGLALAIATADCVPVLIAVDGAVAAVHAGWRGLVAGVIAAALARLPGPAARARAWIGPAIGVCCYEVGEEVAGAVAGAAGASAIVRRPDERPHVDLHAVARLQLEAAGVGTVRTIDLCTRCSPEILWSYRRDGSAAGRNLAFIWRR